MLTAALATPALFADERPPSAPRDVPGFEQLTPALRAQLDAQALACPAEPPLAKDGPFFGGLTGWMVSRVPLSPEEEVRRAERVVAALEQRFRITSPPTIVDEVLRTLAAEVPERLRPPPIEFTLAVIEIPQWVSFTPGGGKLFISRPYLEALLDDPERGRDRLAFVLAHEMGHVCRHHCRRGYQLMALDEAVHDELLTEADEARFRRLLALAARRSGGWIAFLYSRQQDYEADLFAAHLCRNAGFDVEAGLDVLRLWVLRNDRPDPDRMLNGDAAEAGPACRAGPVSRTPEVEPSVPPGRRDVPDASVPPGHFAPAVARLKHLRHELDGTLEGDSFGLLKFDPDTAGFVPLAEGDRALPEGRRGVVLIHGMGSSLRKFVPLAESLTEHDRDGRLVVFGFQYPGDASLARVGRALTREMAAFGDAAARFDFVCHSAGGLAFRWYAEVERGGFRQAVFAGTPHGGSDLARLRELLEVQQFVRDLRLGFLAAAENTILDGDGQIGHDLLPDSLFFRCLDRAERDPARYTVFRGRRFGNRQALWLRASGGALRASLRRSAPESGFGPLRDRTRRWIDRLDLPPEILRGDLAVTLESAELAGVSRIETVRASHHRLQEHPGVIQAVVEIVLREEPAHTR